jgi:hypothetical protein
MNLKKVRWSGRVWAEDTDVVGCCEHGNGNGFQEMRGLFLAIPGTVALPRRTKVRVIISSLWAI